MFWSEFDHDKCQNPDMIAKQKSIELIILKLQKEWHCVGKRIALENNIH